MKDRFERWGPLAFSVAALLVALLYNVNYDRKVAARDTQHAKELGKIQGQLDSEREERQHDNEQLERKFEILQAYTMSLIRDMIKAGIPPSQFPPQEQEPKP